MSKRRAQNTGYLAAIGLVALALVALLLVATPAGGWSYGVIRVAALLGYLAIFASILSSLFMRELVRFFGRSFVDIHHLFSVSGLVLITLHPLAVAVAYQTWRVVLPRLGSWQSFLEWAGPPAWDLLVIASLAALWRRKLKANWRMIHYLTYLAFALGTVHGLMIGTDLQGGVARWVVLLMALGMLYVLIKKRFVRSG